MLIDFNVAVKKSNNGMPTIPEELSNENCALYNFFRQISVYINGKLVSICKKLSNYTSYIQFMLMTPLSYKKLKDSAN